MCFFLFGYWGVLFFCVVQVLFFIERLLKLGLRWPFRVCLLFFCLVSQTNPGLGGLEIQHRMELGRFGRQGPNITAETSRFRNQLGGLKPKTQTISSVNCDS